MNELTTFEQAKLLKELEFDCGVDYYYIDGEEHLFKSRYLDYADFNNGLLEPTISAPTISHALDWCREVKGVYAEIVLEIAGSGYYFILYRTDIGLHLSEPRSFNSYDECQCAALDVALKYIKQQKQ